MTYPSGAADFTDTFTDTADQDPLSNHTPDTGTSWTEPSNNDDNFILSSADSAIYHPTAVFNRFNGAIANVTAGWNNDHTAEATGASADHVQVYACPAVRVADGTSGPRGYVAYHNGGTNRWILARIDSGSTTPTQLSNATFDNSPVSTDRIAVKASADTISLYLNAAASDAADDSYDISGDGTKYDTGSPGVLGRPSAATFLSNFKAWGAAEGGSSVIPKAYHHLIQLRQ